MITRQAYVSLLLREKARGKIHTVINATPLEGYEHCGNFPAHT